jgi:hypothetical protein
MKQCDKIKFDGPKKKTQETKKNIHVDSDVVARAYIGHTLRLGMLSCLVSAGMLHTVITQFWILQNFLECYFIAIFIHKIQK